MADLKQTTINDPGGEHSIKFTSDCTPSSPSNKIYMEGGELKFNGAAIGGSGGGGSAGGCTTGKAIAMAIVFGG